MKDEVSVDGDLNLEDWQFGNDWDSLIKDISIKAIQLFLDEVKRSEDRAAYVDGELLRVCLIEGVYLKFDLREVLRDEGSDEDERADLARLLREVADEIDHSLGTGRPL